MSEVDREAKKFSQDQILNFDETSFYMDVPNNYSIKNKGSKKVHVETTGKEKVRLSCLMTATASGIKLPIVCVVPRKKPIPNMPNPKNMFIIYGTGGNFNSNILCEHYVKYVLAPYMLEKHFSRILIIFDRATCHTQKTFLNCLEARRISYVLIPPRMTGYKLDDKFNFKFLFNFLLIKKDYCSQQMSIGFMI